MGIDYTALFQVEGDATGGNQYETCEGDSGGPALFGTSGNYHVGGVLSGGPTSSTCSAASQYAYIPRGFLDALCLDDSGSPKAWEDCLTVPSNDPDRDGKFGTADNCPNNPNFDQMNSNAATESGMHGGSSPALGDACDPKAHAIVPGANPNQKAMYSPALPGSLLYTHLHRWTSSSIPYRPMGYSYYLDNSNDYSPDGVDTTHKLKAYYCACHKYTTSTPSNPDDVADPQICKSTLCAEDGNPNTFRNINRDTGWQNLNWAEPGGSCPLVDLDGDDITGQTKPFNECNTLLPDRKYQRALGGTVYCTDRSEFGCTASDGDRFWKDSTTPRTKKFSWDWKSQDYPHDPNTYPMYDPTQTPWARIKVWLKPDASYLGMAHNNTYTEPVVASLGTLNSLGKPLYDPPKLRWRVPAVSDPGGPFKPLVVVPVDRSTGTDQLPESFNWTPIAEASATRALLVSNVDSATGVVGEALASRYIGQEGLELDTVDFGVAQVDDAVFALGGQDLDDALSNVLWVGLAGGPGEMLWEVPAGVASSGSASASGATTSTKTGTSQSSKTLPTKSKSSAGKYTDWLAATKKARPIKRPALSIILAKTKSSSSTGGKSGKTSMRSAAVSNGPEPQHGTLLAANLASMTLTAVFGETPSGPVAGSPVSFAIYDIYYQEWVTGEAIWSCGPRHSVGHTSADGAPDVFFYGGELQGTLLDGLFRSTLDPQALLEGQDVEHLDAGASESPGARSYAAMVHQPWERAIYLFGGIGPNGATNDMWRFSLSDNTWTRLSDGTGPDAPPAMIGAGLLVSRIDGSILVVAGTANAGTNERAWRFAGGQWEPTTHWAP